MGILRRLSWSILIVFQGLFTVPVLAAEIKLAVASNFSDAMRVLAKDFERRSGHRLVLVFGSTGKHYAQIKNGAPFDAFFAADARRPRLLEQQGYTVADSRFTYALGRLVLWSPAEGAVDSDGRVLETMRFRRLAMAKPKLAPYGEAAKQVLEARGLWAKLQARLVLGENIAQTFQFVYTGNAQLGFVAYAQIMRPGLVKTGSFWRVPQSLYRPIEQQAVLLTDRAAAYAFLTYVKSDHARKIIRESGYSLP